MRALGLCLLFVVHAGAQDAELQLVRVATGLNTTSDIQNAGDGSGRLFFVQQTGAIRVLSGGNLLPAPFLDIRSRIVSGGERGLLGLAFPPGYAAKSYFYVYYTDLNGNSVVARFRTSSDPNSADPASGTVILTVNQPPFTNHKGGQLRFGPDGYLYVGLGDGGSGGDPSGNGQNKRTLLAKLLRIDVENASGGTYRIPADNPFVNDSSALPEIWAYGLRNPWRFSFDRETRDLWIADVGQNAYEEINFQPASSKGGEDYGWNIMEGLHCFLQSNCSTAGLTLPVHEYSHADGCSVTGGFVYRGQAAPWARGTYIYGDYCSGTIWGLRQDGTNWVNRQMLASGLSITTFGEDEAGEVYVADAAQGEVHRLVFPPPKSPSLTAASVVNAASGAQGMVPGSIASVYPSGLVMAAGIQSAAAIPLPFSLGGIAVKVNGGNVPLYAAANTNGLEQVNFQVPYELAGASSATVTVERDGIASAPVTVTVSPAQPGIFTSGNLAVIVHASDNSLATSGNPLKRGEYAYFYANGLGAVDNQPQTGQAASRSPLSRTLGSTEVTIGGAPCNVLYSGLAPDLVGVFQINIQVPDNLPAGQADLAVSVSGAAGKTATVFVQ